MKKLKWRMSEVVSYVEWKILHNEESADEMEWYENYKYDGKAEKNKVLRGLIKQMSKEYRGEI